MSAEEEYAIKTTGGNVWSLSELLAAAWDNPYLPQVYSWPIGSVHIFCRHNAAKGWLW